MGLAHWEEISHPLDDRNLASQMSARITTSRRNHGTKGKNWKAQVRSSQCSRDGGNQVSRIAIDCERI